MNSHNQNLLFSVLGYHLKLVRLSSVPNLKNFNIFVKVYFCFFDVKFIFVVLDFTILDVPSAVDNKKVVIEHMRIVDVFLSLIDIMHPTIKCFNTLVL